MKTGNIYLPNFKTKQSWFIFYNLLTFIALVSWPLQVKVYSKTFMILKYAYT